jgi:hypothetical protein
MQSGKGDCGRFEMNLKSSGLTGYETRRNIAGSNQAVDEISHLCALAALR